MADANARFCIRCGSGLENHQIMGEQRPACPSCGWVYYADPKVAACILVRLDGKILLVQRGNEPKRGCWTLPAGFVNAGEDPAQAAERECLEETGLQVRVTRLQELIAGREHPRGADIILVYQAEVTGGELRPGDDADQASFFGMDELPDLAFRATYRALGIPER